MAVFSTWLAGALAAKLVAVGVGATLAAGLANVVVGLGAAFASQALAGARTGNRGRTRLDIQAVFNQPAADRVRGYGKRKLGGPRAFFDSTDGHLDQIVMLHHGEIDALEEIYVGDTRVSLDAQGWVDTRPWGPTERNILIRTRTGEANSSAYAGMVETWPQWTTAHQLRNIATIYTRMEAVKIEYFNRLYPEAQNTPIRALCRLSRVYDPRSGRTEWSDNSGLAARDFLVNADGFRLDPSDIDDESVARFADVCDRRRARKAGGTEANYRCWGVFSLAEDPADTLASILATCDGEVYETLEGKIGLRGGEWTEPTVTIFGPEHVLAFEFEQGNDRFAAFNELTASYTEPRRDFQPEDTPRWVDFEDQARRGRLPEQLGLESVPSPTQAQRLAKIWRFKQNPKWRGRISTTLAGLAARGERTIRLVIPELAIDEPFRVIDHTIRSDLSGCDMELASLGPEAYAWTPADDEGETSPPIAEPVIPDLPVPTGLTLTTAVRQFTPTTSAPIVRATVAAPPRPDLTLSAEIRLQPDSAWETMTVPDDGLAATSGPVSEEQDYAVRARWVTAGRSASAWSEIVTITIPPS